MKQELISAIRKLAHDNAFDTEEYEALIEKAFDSSIYIGEIRDILKSYKEKCHSNNIGTNQVDEIMDLLEDFRQFKQDGMDKTTNEEFELVLVNGELRHPFNALLDELNEWLELDKGDWMENLPVGIYKDHFEDKNNWEEVDSGLEVETHRWYERSTTVYKIYGRYLGVTHISNIFSQSMDYEDVSRTHSFREMKPVNVVSYE